MNPFLKTSLAIVLLSSLVIAQGPTWTSNKIEPYNGYDYELWNQNGAGSVNMKLTGDNGSGANAKGGTFEATWSGTENVLFRSGKKFKNNETVSSVGNITVDFEATWSSSDNVKMLGVYGWGYFASGAQPSGFSDQIEYYIIQDRGSYNSATSGTNCKEKGGATIDSIAYKFTECDRINQPMLTGDGNFKQYFSYPTSTSSHRQKGLITVSKHFEEWAKAGMSMNKLYEVAMKVESYTGASRNSNGSAKVTKSLLTIGGSAPPQGTSSSSTLPRSSSSVAPVTVCSDYKTSYCGGSSSFTANTTSIPSGGSCVFIKDFEVIQPSLSSTVSINGVSNTCGSDSDNCNYNDKPAAVHGGYYVYVASGSSINDYENNGWQSVIAGAPNCNLSPPPSSSSRVIIVPSSSSSSNLPLACQTPMTNSTSVPVVGECLFVCDFTDILPSSNSKIVVNGVITSCIRRTCLNITKPDKSHDGYYIFVESGSIASTQEAWHGIVAGEPNACVSNFNSQETKALQNNLSIVRNGVLYINTKNPTSVSIFDIQGNMLQRINVSMSTEVKLHLNKGVYIAKTSQGSLLPFTIR